MLADGPGLGDGDGLSIVTEFYKINGLLRRSRTDGVWLSYVVRCTYLVFPYFKNLAQITGYWKVPTLPGLVVKPIRKSC